MKKYNQSVVVQEQADVVIRRIAESLKNSKRAKSVRLLGSSAVTAKLSTNFLSWGETVTCAAHPTENGVQLDISSESAVSSTLIDYGQNRKNVQEIIELVKSEWPNKVTG